MSRATRILSIATDNPDEHLLEEAAAILRRGGLVAFATETVYGLGADATNPEAVARIFEAKGRPASNPLIVHASDLPMARACVAAWPPEAETLAQRYWPGPLTLVLPRSALIPEIVTAGLPTVGVRIPHPEVARRLIARTGRPIAAPSANRSMGVSPTLAEHVRDDLDGRIDLILDSGQTTIGLESTVVDLTTRQPRILRPGPYTVTELEHVLANIHVREAVEANPGGAPRSPGLLPVHYAPRTRAVRVESPQDLADFPWPERAALIVLGRHELPPLPASIQRFDLPAPGIAARGLYLTLHRCDRMGLDLIVVLPPPEQQEWHAIRDRIRRATKPLRPEPR
ncbi:MAG: threonylcarbamoyl-AMP synthase [Isosphaeraceae bacterium]|nr:threonylcarbamoyl-AMP synthase [Isosphaeraceae bacterium]